MKLAALLVCNFRGIEQGFFKFPINQRLTCVIGPGDSCKSTLLKAIEWCLWPNWGLAVTDLDFYNGNNSSPIVIEATIAELPKLLLAEEKFGLYLRDLDRVINEEEDDEPTDEGTSVVTVRLTVDDSLEPYWEIVTNRTEPKPISQKDRRMLSFSVVGVDYEKDFSWGERLNSAKLFGLFKRCTSWCIYASNAFCSK